MGFLKPKFLLAMSMLLTYGFTFGQHPVKAQRQSFSVQKLVAKLDSFGYSKAPEKLYLQLDKPYYALGDTIWFKAYLLQAGLLIPSIKSGIIYLELAKDSGRVVKRLKLPVISGLSWGSLALDEDELASGSYTIRAYTNWQRNFSENYEFKKNFYISSPRKTEWLVDLQSKVISNAEGKHIKASLQITQADHQPISWQNVLLKVSQNKKIWYNNSLLQTAADGSLSLDFDVPRSASSDQLVVQLQEMSKKGQIHQLFIPLTIKDANDIDLQFMPEGGTLIAGLPAHIGFKAIGSNGYGTNVSGKIKNSKNEDIASFRSAFKGIGSVNFTPIADEIYTAIITLDGGKTKSFSLPHVHGSGFVMRMKPVSQLTDTLELAIASTADLIANDTDYYLIGQAKGIVCSASRVSFAQGTVTGKISTQRFPSGIASITLFNASYQPVCERTIFIDHHKRLHIAVEPNQMNYQARDSISLALKVTAENGRPVTGNLSLTVTDDSQIIQDFLNSGSILSHMLLTQDLKGEVEQPDYYLNDNGIQHLQELDNLLLTQGWVGYSWEEVFTKPQPIRFAAEPEFAITGNVSSLWNHGIAGAKITLLNKNPLLIQDTTTDQEGRFVFNRLPLIDSATSFVLQAQNKKGKSNIIIKPDEFTPQVFAPDHKVPLPWYVNMDSTLANYTNYSRSRQEQQQKFAGIALKEVTIRDKKTIKTSHNLNGTGNADFVLNEEDLLKVSKTSLLDLLQHRIKGFSARVPPHEPDLWFMIHSQKVKFIFDGVDLDFYYQEEQPGISILNRHYDFERGIFGSFTAANIKGVELMSNLKHTSYYNSKYFTMPPADPTAWAYVEITTRDGNGPFINQTPNMAVYRPLPFSLPKQFYRPKYKIKERVVTTNDLRSTIHWEPNIVTDAGGIATVSFYAADLPGSYSVRIEGTDLDGRTSYYSGKLLISPNSAKPD